MNPVPSRTALAAVEQSIHELAPRIAQMLPPEIKPEKFESVVLTALQQNPQLLECAPQTLHIACLKAAQDGLLPDGREGAIVIRWNKRERRKEAHWMPMVAGIIAKAKRKGNVAGLVANIVYQGEPFEVLMGDEEKIIHRREIGCVQRGKELAVYAIATMRDGTKEREVMTWKQVMDVRDVSDGADTPYGPWAKWPDEMARKTVIRRLSKRLPGLEEGDDDLRRAIERVDELYPYGKPAPPAEEGKTIEGNAAESETEQAPASSATEAAPSAPSNPPKRTPEQVRELAEAFCREVEKLIHNVVVNGQPDAFAQMLANADFKQRRAFLEKSFPKLAEDLNRAITRAQATFEPGDVDADVEEDAA